MDDSTSLILFGIRSPLVVEYEESCHRAKIVIRAGISVNGAPRLLDAKLAIPFDQFSAVGVSSPFIACAFAPGRRRALALMAVEKGLVHATALVDPTAAVARSSRVGDGSFVNAGAVIGGLSFLGEGVLLNRCASVGHHSIIGDYVSIGPGATLASNIHVGAGTVIGAGAVILPNVKIGSNVVIAAGSVVRKTVHDGALVAGNPAKAQRFVPARSTIGQDDEE